MKYVAYYRVSTDRQGKSGLGLEAQKAAVKAYLANKGWPPIAEYTEVESGRKTNRPQLEAALAHCRLMGASLVVAKLDRLARNVSFLVKLRDSGVKFVCVDNPNVSDMIITILAAVAQEEAGMISKRTKAALAAAKERGVKLGGDRGYRPSLESSQRAAQAKREAAVLRAQDFRNVLDEVRGSVGGGLRAMAREMNRRGIPTPSSKEDAQWHPATVSRVLAKLEVEK